jgi:hypothetical protein
MAKVCCRCHRRARVCPTRPEPMRFRVGKCAVIGVMFLSGDASFTSDPGGLLRVWLWPIAAIGSAKNQ